MSTSLVNSISKNSVAQFKLIVGFTAISSLVACGGSELNNSISDVITYSTTVDGSNADANGSTQNVLCDYFYSEYNDSDSVQTTRLDMHRHNA